MFRQLGIGKQSIDIFKRSVRFNSTRSSSLNWTEYFNLKKKASRINLACSTITGAGGMVLTLSYLGNVELDFERPIMGIDPIFVMVGVVLLGGGLGWTISPVLGSPVFQMLYRSKMPLFKAKDKIFLQKIKAHRVDPSSQSFSNPVPDYYGEKIFSLKDYRQWLRDCNAYRRKAKEFL